MHWEVLSTTPSASIRRAGRFLVVDLHVPHCTLSTSARNGGQTEHLRHLINHQSCEGSGHETRFKAIHEQGQDGYHDAVCAELGIQSRESAVMGTAANMNYAVVATEPDGASRYRDQLPFRRTRRVPAIRPAGGRHAMAP